VDFGNLGGNPGLGLALSALVFFLLCGSFQALSFGSFSLVEAPQMLASEIGIPPFGRFTFQIQEKKIFTSLEVWPTPIFTVQVYFAEWRGGCFNIG